MPVRVEKPETANAADDPDYQPRDAVGETLRSSTVLAGAGLITSAVQASLAKRNVGTFGALTRYGGNIGLFALVGGSYQFAECVSANLRQKEDSYNAAIGGFIGGMGFGLRSRSLPAVIGYGAMTSVLVSAWDYSGGRLTGYSKDPEVDEFERKQRLRKNRRRPVEETIEELGEGRGIFGPGYAERRKQRLKENYGIDVVGSPSQEA